MRLRPGRPRIDAPIHVRAGRRVLVWILRHLTGAVLRRYRPTVVVIAGSVGKTTTKDLTAAALATRFDLRATERSANSEVGVPATVFGSRRPPSPLGRALLVADGLALLLRRKRFPGLLVLEAAAGRPGELERLTRPIRSDVTAVTNVRTVHREFYGGLDAIRREKSWPVRRLKSSGTAILNIDDPSFAELARLAPGRVLRCGTADGADVRLANVEFEDGGTKARILVGEDELTLRTRLLGAHQLGGALMAVAIARALGVPPADAVAALEGFEPGPGRMRALTGRGRLLVLDDSHNASPAAVVDALDVLARFRKPRCAVLGEMLTLGPEAEPGHRAVGRAAAASADLLVAVGDQAAWIAEAARESGMSEEQVLHVRDAATAARVVQARLTSGTVLVKGSRAVGLESVVSSLTSP